MRDNPYKLKVIRKPKKILNGYFIQLTKSKLVRVDKNDFKELSKFNWHAQQDRKTLKFTAKRGTFKNGIRKSISMHRQIMNCPDDLQVDHINGDTLDNRRKNLRICTTKENNRNRKFKGCYQNPFGTWNARITVDYKSINLGNFKNEKDARNAYLKATKKYFGKFANLKE